MQENDCWTFGARDPPVLKEAFRHELRVNDVVSSLVSPHYMEAAVATTVEKPQEPKSNLSGDNINSTER